MTFHMIQPEQIEHIRKTRGALIIDVREPEEYRQSHFPGAGNVPYEELEQRMGRIPRRPLILYCDYGSTSLLAARRLGAAGYEIYAVAGGLEAMKRLISIDR